MKQTLCGLALSVTVLSFGGLLTAGAKKPKPGPLTGTWECMSHGGSQGDMPFTLYLEQDREVVTGSVSSPIGGTDLTSATFKKKTLEIHIDTPNGNYLIQGKLKKHRLSGTWSLDAGEKGTWEGKKAVPPNP
jgi:hypothetical protein